MHRSLPNLSSQKRQQGSRGIRRNSKVKTTGVLENRKSEKTRLPTRKILLTAHSNTRGEEMWLETLYIYTRHASKSNVRHIQDFIIVLWKLKLSQFLKFLPLTLNLKTIVKCYIPFKKKKNSREVFCCIANFYEVQGGSKRLNLWMKYKMLAIK